MSETISGFVTAAIYLMIIFDASVLPEPLSPDKNIYNISHKDYLVQIIYIIYFNILKRNIFVKVLCDNKVPHNTSVCFVQQNVAEITLAKLFFVHFKWSRLSLIF